jgi:hypothetical protein
LHDTQTVLETPSHEGGIAHWGEKARTCKRRCRTDQRFQVRRSFSNRMAKETYTGGITSQATVAPDHGSRALLNRCKEFAWARVTVNPFAQIIGFVDIDVGRGADQVAIDL